MDLRHLELAAEFAQLTGKADLVVYLGLPPETTSDEAKAALRARRKKMQGMQANPKYRREAVFLIKHSGAFDTLLDDLDAYRRATVAGREVTQVPILEMAVQGALAGGALAPEQQSHLQEMARTLGISDDTFHATVARLSTSRSVPLIESLDVSLPPGLTMSEPSSGAPTAPPVRARTHGPGGPPPVTGVGSLGQTLGINSVAPPPQLEIIGDPIRYIELGKSPVVHEIRVRNRGKNPVPARVSADAGWLSVSPKVLDPSLREQTISVHVDPSRVDNPPQSGVVHIVTDRDGRTSIVFEAIAPKPNRRNMLIAVGLGVVVIVAVVLAILATQP